MTKVFRTLKKVTGIEKLNDKLEEKLLEDKENYDMRRRVNHLTKLQPGKYDLTVTEDGNFHASLKRTEIITADGNLEVDEFEDSREFLFVVRKENDHHVPNICLSTICHRDSQLASFEELKQFERRFTKEATTNYLVLRDGLYIYKPNEESGTWIKASVK